ncbi:MAG: hypothetical protein M1503_05940 [Thaumarchaeota archaeon]|nr:hypothetical protein [Nitrososphaerota archaeon]MCL5317785.1 hypothetical protein [Nitrososphaerota archaeon]
MAKTVQQVSAMDKRSREQLMNLARQKGFQVEENRDYGYGTIDMVWNIDVHPALPQVKLGFIVLRAEEPGDTDLVDEQFTIRKIEESAMRGIRSGMDKVYLVTQDEEQAKSVSGKIEWLAANGSILRLDAIALGLFPSQTEPSVMVPSQDRVPVGEKLQKLHEQERARKIAKYSPPKRQKQGKISRL